MPGPRPLRDRGRKGPAHPRHRDLAAPRLRSRRRGTGTPFPREAWGSPPAPAPPAGLRSLPCGLGGPRCAGGAASTAERGAGRGRRPTGAPSLLPAEGLPGAGPRRLIHWPRARRGPGARAWRSGAGSDTPRALEPGLGPGKDGPRGRVTSLPGAGRTHRGRLRPAALPPPRRPAWARGPASALRRSGRRVSMMEPARPTRRAPRHRWLRRAARPAACACACACASALRLVALCPPARSGKPGRAPLAAGRIDGRRRGCGPDSWVVGSRPP